MKRDRSEAGAFWGYNLFILAAAAVFFAGLSWFALQRYAHFESGEDLAMFDQMLWSVRQGYGLATSLSGNPHLQFPHHFFGEHVSPILYLLAWPAGLTRGPEALLIMQSLALALAAFPLWRLAAALTNSNRLGMAAAIGWLAQPALFGAALYDFHMEAFEGLFLFCFAWALFRGRWHAVCWAILYASCKEDAPIYLAAVAPLLGWKFRQNRIALPVTVLALLYAFVAVLWIGPAFSPTGKHLLIGRMLTPITCGGIWPWVSAVMLRPERWIALAGHLFAIGMLPVLGGWFMVPAAMAMGLMWLSTAGAQSLLELHYPLTVYPLFFISAVEGLRRLSVFFDSGRHPYLRRHALVGMIVFASIGLPLAWNSQKDRFREIGLGRAGGALAACRIVDEMLEQLPKDQPISVLQSLSAHMARRQHLNLMTSLHDADWLVIRLDGQGYPIIPLVYHQWLDGLLATNSTHGVYALAGDQVVALRRSHPGDLNIIARHTTRYLEAEYLPRKIGRAKVDLRSQNGLVCEAGVNDRQDWMLFGCYMDLTPGRYRVGFRIKTAGLNETDHVVLDIPEQRGNTVLGKIVLDRQTSGYEWLETDITVITGKDVEFRCRKEGAGKVQLDAIRWQRLD